MSNMSIKNFCPGCNNYWNNCRCHNPWKKSPADVEFDEIVKSVKMVANWNSVTDEELVAEVVRRQIIDEHVITQFLKQKKRREVEVAIAKLQEELKSL